MVDRAVITAFARATMETWQEMLRQDIVPRRAKTEAERDPGDGVHSLIALDGLISGAIGLSMPPEVALKTVSTLVGETYPEVGAEVVDGVQEMVNIVVGRAKKLMEANKLSFQFGLPKTLVGIQFPTPEEGGYRNLAMIFSGSLGEFLVNLTWKGQKPAPVT